MRWYLTLLAVALLLPSCTVGPDYKRPPVNMPDAYRGATAAPAPSVGDLAWWELFGDSELQTLIREALGANYDLQIAVTRILQAEAQVTVARSQLWPTVNALAEAPYTRFTGAQGNRPPNVPREIFAPLGGATISWELDLWGRLRRATESAPRWSASAWRIALMIGYRSIRWACASASGWRRVCSGIPSC